MAGGITKASGLTQYPGRSWYNNFMACLATCISVVDIDTSTKSPWYMCKYAMVYTPAYIHFSAWLLPDAEVLIQTLLVLMAC